MEVNRFVSGMTNEDYHGYAGVSKTTLDLAASDPHKVAWSKVCPVDEEKLKTFDFGDAMHAICLEPDRLKSEFIVMPKFGQKNVDKTAKLAWLLEHKHLKVLSEDDHKKLNLMFESVMAHQEARELIEDQGIAEGSYFWTDEKTGMLGKCRPDKNIESKNLLVDVKTTPDLKKFAYSVDDYRYYVQDPWYCDGVKNVTGEKFRMEFLVIQKHIDCGRYPVEVLRLPEDAIEYGREIYRRDMDNYAEFMQLEKPPATRELDMGFRFSQKVDQHYGEIF
jgi:exodeoxyribonuclease VIII